MQIYTSSTHTHACASTNSILEPTAHDCLFNANSCSMRSLRLQKKHIFMSMTHVGLLQRWDKLCPSSGPNSARHAML